MMYILGAMIAGAGVLALYERRKGKRLVHDDAAPAPHDRERAAHTDAERIRAEGVALHNPSGGHGMF